MTANLDLAQELLNVALSCGFRESGIMSTKSPPMLAVRTNGLSFDSIIGFWDNQRNQIRYTVDEDYLRNLIDISNMRFKENDRRRERFLTGVAETLCRNNREGKPDWEPADVRRERLRAEGLAKQAAKRATAVPATVSSGTESTAEGNLNLNSLLAL